MKITIQASNPAEPSARQLIEQLDRYLIDLYPTDSNHLLSVEALQQAEVTFLTAKIEGRAIGCGAIVNRDGEYAELKRMYVLPEFRGLKIGCRLLEELESSARAIGINWVKLETGIYQPEALEFYKRAGYQICPPFGEYQLDPLSIFMKKKLRSTRESSAQMNED